MKIEPGMFLKQFTKGNLSFTPEKGSLKFVKLDNNIEMIFNNGNGDQKVFIFQENFNELMKQGSFIDGVYSKKVFPLQYINFYLIVEDSEEYNLLKDKVIEKKKTFTLHPGYECIISTGGKDFEVTYFGEFFTYFISEKIHKDCTGVSSKKMLVFRNKETGNFFFFVSNTSFEVKEILQKIRFNSNQNDIDLLVAKAYKCPNSYLSSKKYFENKLDFHFIERKYYIDPKDADFLKNLQLEQRKVIFNA